MVLLVFLVCKILWYSLRKTAKNAQNLHDLAKITGFDVFCEILQYS